MRSDAAAEPPTVEERVAKGLEINCLEGGSIVPFPMGCDLNSFSSLFARGAGGAYFKLHSEGYRTTALYPYHDQAGRPIFAVLRMEYPEKGKQILPLRATRAIGVNPNLEIKSLEAPRPLYGLDRLAALPDAPVLIVEGEKAVEAGRLLINDHVVITWPGGASGIRTADWRPLTGREVVIWPDNDMTGRDAAEALGRLLMALGVASLRIVQVPAHFPKKWDLADPIPELAHVE